MDATTCIQKLRLIHNVSMATVDEEGDPQVREIDVMHVEAEKLYFLTARGKPFYSELLREKKVAILGLSNFKEMIRLNGEAELLAKEVQGEWLGLIFEENPYLGKVYPDATREVLDVFCVEHGEIEYFHLGTHPIVRETYTIGSGSSSEKKYKIGDSCTGCGICLEHCPQKCIETGVVYKIIQRNCLQCGLCKEKCPAQAVVFQKKEPLRGVYM
jgi:uncharacterized pyridoxamine 5'-phosphate oxidase family protein/NAD-dependent dihydropyrimidine dehydrogenase PreA subunit